MKNLILYWTLRAVAALILLQTLYFKFTGAEESVYIFSTLGIEPWGRIGTGVLELIAGICLFIPRISGLAALLSLGLMSGAIFSHLTQLGIVVQDDGGQLFLMAAITWLCSLVIVYTEKDNLKSLLEKIYPRR